MAKVIKRRECIHKNDCTVECNPSVCENVLTIEQLVTDQNILIGAYA